MPAPANKIAPSMTHIPVAYTIGYEGRELDEFVARLREQRIQVLIDIREKPASRKPGFSKTPLREALEEAGWECHRSAVSDMLKELDGNGLTFSHI